MIEGYVFKNSLYYMFASTLPVVSGFILLPIYSFYLSPEEYAVYTLSYSFMTLLVVILSLQLHGSIGRFYFEFEGDSLRSYLSSLVVLLVIVSIVGGALADFMLDDIMSWVYPNIDFLYYEVFRLSIVIAVFQVFMQSQMALLRVREQARSFMKISLVVALLGASMSVVQLVMLENSVIGLQWAILIQSVAGTVAFSFANRRFFTVKVSFDLMREPLRYSVPLIPHALFGFVFMYADKILLEKYVPLHVLGVYAFSDKIASSFKLLVNQFNAAYSPVFNKAAKDSKARAGQMSRFIANKVVVIFVLALTLLALNIYELIYYLFDEKYLGSWKFVAWLAWAYLFRTLYCFSSLGIFYDKKTMIIAKISMLAGILSLLLNFALIPEYGIAAAVFAFVASFLASHLFALLWSKGGFFIPLDYRLIFSCVCLSAGLIGGGYVLNTTLYAASHHPNGSIIFAKIIVSALLVGLVSWWLSNRLPKV